MQLLVPRRKLLRLGAGAAGSALAAPFVLRRAVADDFLLGVGTKKGTGGVGPTAFDPSKLVGQYGAFYRADLGVTQSSGNVTGWADQGVYGWNVGLSQGQPIFSATKFNTSHPGIGFGTQSGFGSQTNDALHLDNFLKIWTTTLSVFMGITLGSTVVNGGQLLTFAEGDAASLQFATNTGPKLAVGVGGFFTPGGVGNAGLPISVSASVPLMLGLILNGATAQFYNDQATSGSAQPFTHTIGRSTAFNGSFDIGTATNSCSNMVLAWLLWTSRVLNATDISNIASWSNTNFGTSF